MSRSLFFTQEPLLLYACGFSDLKFRRTERAARVTADLLSEGLERNLVAAAMASSILGRLDSDIKVLLMCDEVAELRL